jgi:uncharacterized protein with WD repeat
LKKEFLPLHTIPLKDVLSVKWSPQGKYLAVNEGTALKLYGGNDSFTVQQNIDFNIKEFNLSSDEAYVATFSGYSEIDEHKNKEVNL